MDIGGDNVEEEQHWYSSRRRHAALSTRGVENSKFALGVGLGVEEEVQGIFLPKQMSFQNAMFS